MLAAPGPVSVAHRGEVANPLQFQDALRKRNADLKKSVLEEAFQGSGDLDAWMSKTRTVAVQTALYGAGVNLDVNRQRHDPPEIQQQDVSALAAQDRRAIDDVSRLVNGTAGLQEWFKRAQQLGFVAAAHASRASEFCDASTVDAVAGEIRSGMEAALSSATGSGGVQYWADQTGSAAGRLLRQTRMTSLADVARGALPSSAPASAPDPSLERLRSDLSQHRERTLSSLGSLAFGTLPDSTGEGLETALLAGAQALEYSGRVSLDAARLRRDLAGPDEATMAELASKADREIARATSLGLQGRGTAQYWFECNAVMAADANAHAALVATHCNGALAEAIRPQLSRLMSFTPASTYGDAHTWMKSAETTAYASMAALQEVSVELRAAAASQRVRATQTPASDVAVEERQRLEVDRTLHQARMSLWDETMAARGREQMQLQTRINDLSARIKPLTDVAAGLDRRATVIGRIGLGGAAAALGGLLLSAAWQVPGLCVAAASGCIVVGTVIANARNQREKHQVDAERMPLEKEIEDVAPPLVAARTLANAAHKHREDAEQALRTVDGQLEVHHMADAVNKPGDATVDVDEDSVRIGDVVIPRRRLARNETRNGGLNLAGLLGCTKT